MKWSLIALVCVTACKEKPAAKTDPWASGSAATPSTNGDKPSSGEKKWYQTGEAPVGVWMGIDERMSADALIRGNPLSTTLRLTTMIVWPDGHASDDAPWAGLADFDYATWARDVKSNASLGGSPATYTPDGGGWKLKFDSGFEATMAMDGDYLRYRKARLKRAADVTGATLDGTYTWWSNPEDPLLAGPGCQQLVSFKADGTFENRGGFARTCPAGDSDIGKPGSGTYEIRDFSLILKYADGRTDKRLITARQTGDLHTDNAAPVIMGQVWQRRTGPTSDGPIAASPTTTVATTPAAPAVNGDMTTYDAIAFATPPGDLQKNKDSLQYTAKDGDAFCMTYVYSGVPSTGKPASDFAADWKDIMLNGRAVDESPEPQQGQTPSGLVFNAAGTMTTENVNNARVYRALMVFVAGGKRVSVMFVAPTQGQLEGCHMENFLTSVRGA